MTTEKIKINLEQSYYENFYLDKAKELVVLHAKKATLTTKINEFVTKYKFGNWFELRALIDKRLYSEADEKKFARMPEHAKVLASDPRETKEEKEYLETLIELNVINERISNLSKPLNVLKKANIVGKITEFELILREKAIEKNLQFYTTNNYNYVKIIKKEYYIPISSHWQFNSIEECHDKLYYMKTDLNDIHIIDENGFSVFSKINKIEYNDNILYNKPQI